MSDSRPCLYCGEVFTPDKWHPKTEYCHTRHRDLAYNERRRGGRGVPVVETPLETETLIQQIHDRGFYVTKAPQSSDEHFKIDLKRFEGDRRRFAVVSDTHLCSEYQQLTFLKNFYRLCSEREISDVLHCGDLSDGNGKVYKGHEYEIFLHGFDKQCDYIIEHYPKEEGVTTWAIAGNHDESFFKGGGHDLVKAVSEKRPDIKYFGFHGANISLAGAEHITMYLHHPRGAMPYARSYRLQKVIENMAPEQKPMFMFSGHLHTVCILPGYRNVEALSVPCFQSQTPLLKAMGVYPLVAGIFVDFTFDGTGIVSTKYEVYPFYIPIARDY